jgi:hypothetical protein
MLHRKLDLGALWIMFLPLNFGGRYHLQDSNIAKPIWSVIAYRVAEIWL